MVNRNCLAETFCFPAVFRAIEVSGYKAYSFFPGTVNPCQPVKACKVFNPFVPPLACQQMKTSGRAVYKVNPCFFTCQTAYNISPVQIIMKKFMIMKTFCP
jgi:hypothetical protein